MKQYVTVSALLLWGGCYGSNKWLLWLHYCDVTHWDKQSSKLCDNDHWPLTCMFHIPCMHTPEIITHWGLCDNIVIHAILVNTMSVDAMAPCNTRSLGDHYPPLMLYCKSLLMLYCKRKILVKCVSNVSWLPDNTKPLPTFKLPLFSLQFHRKCTRYAGKNVII